MASMGKATPDASGKLIMDKNWELVQKKTFTKWVNSHLRKRGKDSQIDEITKDFSDGLKLITFLEVISSKDDWSKKRDKAPKMRIQKIQNVDMCMKFLKAEGVKLIAIQAENIVDGDLTLILGMIWTIIQQYQIADISEEELTAKEALLLWCQKKTKGYRDVDPPGIKNFHTSWCDGLALCALIHKHRPDLLDYEQCKKSTPHDNARLAFRIAEEKLGIPQLLDVEDLCDTAKPDERSVITYVVQYYHVFAKSQKGEVAGRRVGKLIELTKAVNRLKNEYNERATALRQWIEKKITWLDDRDFGKTEEEIADKLAEYNQYKTTEKPPKAGEKLGCEGLFNSIQVKLSSNNRSPFVPAEGLTPSDINALWAQLLEAERNREAALRGARTRERALNGLNARLDDKAARLEHWIEKSDKYLATNEPVESLSGANSKLKQLDAWNGEYADTKPRVAELKSLAGAIADLNGPTAAAAKQRADGLEGRFNGLKPKADAKQTDLNEKLAREKAKEAARQAWATAAKDYVQWAQQTAEKVKEDRYFGDSVEAVEKDKTRLDADDKSTKSENATKKAVVDHAWAELQKLGVKENKYSPLTINDTNAADAHVQAELASRGQAWSSALAAEQQKEAKRKEFAAAAQSFVDGVEARRKELDGLQGEPAPLIATLGKNYADGKPEKAGLEKLSALQAECTALGITSNKHTTYNLQSLRASSASLERFVKNKQAALQEEHDLKHDYEARATALVSWIGATQPKIADRATNNALDDARDKLAAFQAYRTTEKAAKANDKLALGKLEQSIQAHQQANNRPAFKPQDALSLATIDKSWAALETAETAKGEFLRAYLTRQEELAVLAKRFAGDAADLSHWLDDKNAYLAKQETIENLYQAQYATVLHQSYEEEYAGRKARVTALGELAAKIESLDYADKVAVRKSADDIAASYAALAANAAKKQHTIADGLKAEQTKEDARLVYASRAKEFARWAAVAQQNIGDRTFGFTLATVTAHGAKIDASDAELNKEADAHVAQIRAADKALRELHVKDNAHTKLTVADADATRASLAKALKERRTDYDTELAQQTRWDRARQQFANDASAFVGFLAAQQKAVHAAAHGSGSHDERANAIRAVHQDGKPGAAKLVELGASADAMTKDGIVGNDYTGYTMPLLRQRNEQFDNFVKASLANVDDAKAYAAQTSKLEAEYAALEQQEQSQFEFNKKATLLSNWLSNAGAFLTEPTAATTVDEVEQMKSELASFNKDLAAHQRDYDELAALAPKVKDGSQLKDVTAKWNETKALADKRQAALGGESSKQQNNEALRKKFAAAAAATKSWLDGQSAKLAGTSGDLSAQQKALESLTTENAAGDAKLASVGAVSDELDAAGVTDNPHTAVSMSQLKAEYEQLQDATKAKLKLVEQEMAKKNNSSVSAEQLAEFREVFSHFDKDKDATLRSYELKACLNSLGDDCPDAEITRLLQTYGGGDHVNFDGFVKLMTSRVQDSDTQDAIVESFKIIAGDKSFVTESDVRSVFDKEQADYLLSVMPKNSDGYDYVAWTKKQYD